MDSIYCYDPTANDPLSKVRGIGRYLQILKENFPDWNFVNNITIRQYNNSVFVNPFFNFLMPPLTLKRLARKQVAVIHDLTPLKYPEHFPIGLKGKLNVFLNKLALRNYDLVVTDSEASKRDIVDLTDLEENKVKVIYPCLPKIFTEQNVKTQMSNVKSKSKNSKSKEFNISQLTFNMNNYCIYVGDATWNKNLVNLAKALKKINLTCVFVGKIFDPDSRLLENDNGTMKQFNNNAMKNDLLNHPWGREFVEFLKEVNNDKRFVFLGYIPDEKLIQLYQRANCNILVSKNEGFGFSYLEAASQNCPSILSDISVFKEISNKQGVEFTDPDQVDDIANAIGEVYFNQDLRNKLGSEAKLRSEFFTQSLFTSEFLKILNF